jgi:hypothetical protein
MVDDAGKASVLQHLAEGRLVATRHHKVGFSGTSGVWARFSLLVRPYSQEPVGFVQCNGCQGVLRYDSHRTGTSSLKRHRCVQSLKPVSSKDTVQYWLWLYAFKRGNGNGNLLKMSCGMRRCVDSWRL